MPFKKIITIAGCLLLVVAGYGQTNPPAVPPVIDSAMAIDTSLDYGDLLDEFDNFIDSLQAPRSYFLINVSAGNAYFDFKNKASTVLTTRQKTIYSPAIGYYHKKGPGITFSGNMIDDGVNLNFYQYAISPSFDFVQSKKWIGGFSYTRFITKDSLPFYTTPLQNEVNGYFIYRKSWLQPGLNVVYGWGSNTDVKKRERFLRLKRLRRLGGILTTTTTTEKNIADFSIAGSVRHNFYWRQVFSPKDYIKLTPMLTFTAGTQKYGFNQERGTTAVTARNTGDVILNDGNTNLDNNMKFQPLSLTLSLKPEYAIGKFFIQPQLILDYYFPNDSKQFTLLYSLNAGFMF